MQGLNGAAGMQAGLLLDRVGVRAGRRDLLDGLSMAVQPARLLAVLGGAGAGKSTLMAVLAGELTLSTGHLLHGGADLRRTMPHRRGFGVVAQKDALFPHLSLAQNVAYPLGLRGVKRRDRARLVEATLETLMLSNPGRLPHQATAAERQRTWIARAAVFGPTVLLLDEPLSHQSPEDRPMLLAALRRLHLLLGAVTVLTTRVAGDAMALADQLAVLHAGRIVQAGTPASVYEQPGSATAALACGDANLLPGIVRAIDEDGLARVGLTCGPQAEGVAGEGLRVRDRCLFCLRPERIAVAPTAAAEMGEDALDCTVLEALHLGDDVQLRLLLGAGQEVRVKRPAAAGLRGLRAGESVAIAWQPQNASVFPAARSEESASF